MPSVYMTKEMFQKLDNKELITKQMDINAKIEGNPDINFDSIVFEFISFIFIPPAVIIASSIGLNP